MTTDKNLPGNREAEASVVASVMVDETAFDRIDELVAGADFLGDACRWAFEAARRLWLDGQPVNQVTVADDMGDKLTEAGGLPWIARLTADLVTPVGVEHYAAIVRRGATLRQLIQAGQGLIASAYKDDADPDVLAARYESLISSCGARLQRGPVRSLGQVLAEMWDVPGDVSQAMTVRTGLQALDELVSLQPSELVIVAARPSVGKSALLLNIARNAAVSQNARGVIFTLEMDAESWAERALSRETNIEGQRMRLRDLNDHDQQRASAATAQLSELPLYLDERGQIDIGAMRSTIRRQRDALKGLEFVMVDYLQLMGAEPSRRNRSREQEVSDISRGLKALAKEFRVPVIAAAQLSRAVESRATSEPRLSDLRESGSIEQDADVVIFLWRPTEEEWTKAGGSGPPPQDRLRLIVAKNRNGPTGVCGARFERATSRFEDVEVREEPMQEQMPWAR